LDLNRFLHFDISVNVLYNRHIKTLIPITGLEMSSKNFSFDLQRPNFSEYSDELFYKQFAFLKDEMSVKGNIVSTMLKDFKKELAQFHALKKIIDQSDCPVLLQSTAYSNLSASNIHYDAKQLRALGVEFIINTYGKLNRLYWVALFDKLNLTRISHTRHAENLLASMEGQKFVAVKDALENFGYGDLEDGKDIDLTDMHSIYLCADFNAKNISTLLKEITKPLNKVQIRDEFKNLVEKHGMKAEYYLGALKVTGSRSGICKNVVSMLYMITDKKDWLEKFTVNHLTSEYGENALRNNTIPTHLVETFEKFHGAVTQ